MKHVINATGARDYLRATYLSYEYNIIGATVLFERLEALARLGNPNCASVSLAWEFLSDQGVEPEGEHYFAFERNTGENSSGQFIDEPNDPFIAFMATIDGNEYVFHKGDMDIWPSVPHSHHLHKRKQKLDPYLGWIYRQTTQIDRASRKAIIDLWNCEKLRLAAIETIRLHWRLKTKHDWPVQNPLKLPLKRRK